MKTHKTLILTATILTATFAVLIAGCDNKPAMPEVNDENCKLENINKIKNKEMQQEFSNRCFLRGNYKPSPKREW